MAVSTAPARIARPGLSCAPTRGRGHPAMVTIRRVTLMGGLIEGMALAQDALVAAERIQTIAAAGSRQMIANEAGHLGVRATKALNELRRLAGEAEE